MNGNGKYEVNEQIGIITISRPAALNALNTQVIENLINS
jgi:enoyl-CoA hydratase/carnithine racemase